MNQEIKARWVAALRSGKYVQTTASLRNPVGFCCLGVLVDVIDPDYWEGTVPGCRGIYTTISAYPILDAAGLGVKSGSGGHLTKLIEMNDTQGADFAEIANYVEERL